MNRRVNNKFRFAVISQECKIPVKGGLAVTPADMLSMAEKGIAVSSQVSSDFDDGSIDVGFDIPIEETRGVDISDIWLAQIESRKKIKDTYMLNKKKYGDASIKN